ncbi:hypothetical protein HPB47_007097 [Ixodes persulcatus]|uniref:Uncharacterized protein n=1 Tax=Ixodes persulcatus TaxID=34615 RepID=A0AC60P9D5_IXOPE|nr:hypothetical protein HPB47_007097 [Ixodes persulcatus]
MQRLSVYVDGKLLRRPGREKLLHSVKNAKRTRKETAGGRRRGVQRRGAADHPNRPDESLARNLRRVKAKVFGGVDPDAYSADRSRSWASSEEEEGGGRRTGSRIMPRRFFSEKETGVIAPPGGREMAALPGALPARPAGPYSARSTARRSRRPRGQRGEQDSSSPPSNLRRDCFLPPRNRTADLDSGFHSPTGSMGALSLLCTACRCQVYGQKVRRRRHLDPTVTTTVRRVCGAHDETVAPIVLESVGLQPTRTQDNGPDPHCPLTLVEGSGFTDAKEGPQTNEAGAPWRGVLPKRLRRATQVPHRRRPEELGRAIAPSSGL